MKTEMQRVVKIMGIISELYEMDPEYFKHAFFNMYYQIKKKKVVDDRSYNDDELKRKIWDTLNHYENLIKENVEQGKAFNIAYRYNDLDKDIFIGVTNALRAFRSAKKTKFRDI